MSLIFRRRRLSCRAHEHRTLPVPPCLKKKPHCCAVQDEDFSSDKDSCKYRKPLPVYEESGLPLLLPRESGSEALPRQKCPYKKLRFFPVSGLLHKYLPPAPRKESCLFGSGTLWKPVLLFCSGKSPDPLFCSEIPGFYFPALSFPYPFPKKFLFHGISVNSAAFLFPEGYHPFPSSFRLCPGSVRAPDKSLRFWNDPGFQILFCLQYADPQALFVSCVSSAS